jgi:hypothetical protein
MKKLLGTLLCAITFNAVQAQETQTLIKKLPTIKKFGFYFAPEYQYGSLAGKGTSFSGSSGMLIFNQKFSMGLAGYQNMNRVAPSALNASNAVYLSTSYGGLKFEYTPKPTALVHVSFPLLLGGGFAKQDSGRTNKSFYSSKRGGRGDFHNDFFRGDRNFSEYFVVQPGINLETNLFKYGKFFFGANYRLGIPLKNNATSTAATTFKPLSTSNLSGVSAQAGFKFGFFDLKLRDEKNARNTKRNRGNRKRALRNTESEND